MKRLCFVIYFFLCTTSSFADQYSNKFSNCLIQNTTDRDKIILVRWLFTVIAEHSALSNEFKVTKDQKIKNDRAAADYVEYILGSMCLVETKNVLKYEGEEGFLKAFENIGELAMITLMEDKKVMFAMERYTQYLDKKLINKILKD